jgi:hypothetical protein
MNENLSHIQNTHTTVTCTATSINTDNSTKYISQHLLVFCFTFAARKRRHRPPVYEKF